MLNISLKNIRTLPLTAVLCVALLAACGGGGGGNAATTISADQAAFNAVLVRYDAAGTATTPAAAVTAYKAAIADFTAFKAANAGSGRIDDADYYIARSMHELVLLGDTTYTFANANTEYLNVVTGNLNKADNAQFYIGKILYDQLNYAGAIIEFDKVLNPTTYPSPSAGDDAQYYIGRSKHEQALIAQVTVNPNPTATTLFNEARTAYNVLFTATYNLSTRRDDARYQIGRTYFDVAIPTATDYSNALGHFQTVINTYGITASSADDAQYYIGRTLHEGALLATPPGVNYTLANAQVAYTTLLSTYAVSTRRDDAQYQIGKTHFDALTPSIENYNLAIAAFNLVLSTYTTAASSADDAQYFKARSIHEKALLAVAPATPAAGLVEARTAYGVVLSATYPVSTRRDDAKYQIGKTHFDAGDFDLALPEFEAVLTTPFTTATVKPSVGDDAQYFKARSMHALATTVAAYGTARAEYAKVTLANFPFSNRIDDAAFWSAFTYHDSTQCNAERTAMTSFVTAYQSSTTPSTIVFVADANAHITDLNIAPSADSQNHQTCI